MDPIILLISIVLVITVVSLLAGRGNLSDSATSSMLRKYAKDLTFLAHENSVDPVIGRDEEIKKVIEVLSRRKKNNPLLVGKAGVGKTAVVEGLARAIDRGAVPETLKGKKLLSLDLTSLVAGTKYRGEFEKRLKILLREVIRSERQIILFIDEIHSLLEAGGAEGAIDAEDILKPVLTSGDFQLIGASTFADYHHFIAPHQSFLRRFHVITIDESTDEETLDILQGLRSRYESYHGVKISDEALEHIIKVGKLVMPDRVMPDKAIDLMDEAAAKLKLDKVANQRKYATQEAIVGPIHVNKVVNDWRRDSVINEVNV